MSQKESFYSKQSLKFQQSQFTIEKLSQDITNYEANLKEVKSENSKVQVKLSEQVSRFKELKTKHDELIKKLETKSSLLEVAKEQIKTLEGSLRSFVNFYRTKKKLTAKILSEKAVVLNESAKTDDKNSIIVNPESLQSENDHIYYINLASEILKSNQDARLNYLLIVSF